ncbi:TPA: ead/Ea22-like family protein [Salmonella enterica]|nr:ead/Ea22-like family protein [Salmonella enterica]EAZ0561157.1 ead/Ea22-like family protein [Salmonella enterica]EBA5671295.1 ead/Ea22-like family protein [Salmonella enterica]HAF3951131.1 ead/Ea22-like family protein [Salmonella enterica]
MSNIDKQALLGADKHANQHRLSRLIIEANSAELRAIAEAVEQYTDQIIAALADSEKRIAELEHYKSREERVTKLVLDNSTSWDALYKKLEAAEKRTAELDQRLIEYAGIATREAHRVAELEARKVNLSKLSVGEVMHMSGFSRDYADGWCAGNDNAIHEIRTAGIKVKE